MRKTLCNVTYKWSSCCTNLRVCLQVCAPGPAGGWSDPRDAPSWGGFRPSNAARIKALHLFSCSPAAAGTALFTLCVNNRGENIIRRWRSLLHTNNPGRGQSKPAPRPPPSVWFPPKASATNRKLLEGTWKSCRDFFPKQSGNRSNKIRIQAYMFVPESEEEPVFYHQLQYPKLIYLNKDVMMFLELTQCLLLRH